MSKVYKLDQYRKEAKIGPFVLDTDETQLVIPPPTGETLLLIGEVSMYESRKFLQLLAGEQFPALWELVKDEPAEILVGLLRDLVSHFKVGAFQESPGGSVALPS